MKTFFKWTAATGAAAVGFAVMYAWASEARSRIDRGLARAERITDDARQALAKTQDALGETQSAVREMRGAIG